MLAITRFRFQAIDQIDDILEACARPITDGRTCNRDGQAALARPGATDEDYIALMGNESAGGQIPNQRFIDRRIGKMEVIDVLGQRQLGDGELADGPGLFLGNLRL